MLLWVFALLMLSAAAALGVIAWRTARGARDRESARVELLRALAFPDASVVPASGQWHLSGLAEFQPEPKPERETAPAENTDEPAPAIFAERPESVKALPRWMALAGVGAAMALGVTLYAVIARGPESASATGVSGAPIELLALQHRFGPETGLDVTGLIRNPADGRPLQQVEAVVHLVDANGRVVTSQVTPLERPVLAAGQTSAFSLVFPHVTGAIARYQVEFRWHGRNKIPHVDRRAVEAGAKAPTS
jgi:hypothetical protein